MTTSEPPILYSDGNGRLTCSALKCAGMTAHFSGMKRDLNGARILRMTQKAARDFKASVGEWPACESCGAPAKA